MYAIINLMVTVENGACCFQPYFKIQAGSGSAITISQFLHSAHSYSVYHHPNETEDVGGCVFQNTQCVQPGCIA